MLRIGSRYKEVRSGLINKIKNNEISILESESKNHVCYFCSSRIKR